jgi:hypothetical protein
MLFGGEMTYCLSTCHAAAAEDVHVITLPSKFSIIVVSDCADTTESQQEMIPVINKMLVFFIAKLFLLL